MLPHINKQTGLARLKHQRLVAVHLRRHEDRLLHLDQSPEFAVEVLQQVVPFRSFFDDCMAAGDGDVISDSNVALLASANPDLGFVLGIDYVKDFLRVAV